MTESDPSFRTKSMVPTTLERNEDPAPEEETADAYAAEEPAEEPPVGVLKKGRRKRLARLVRETLATDLGSTEPSADRPKPRRRLKVLEIFTWAATITLMAASAAFPSWTTGQPISLETGYDLSSISGRSDAWKAYAASDADLLVMVSPSRYGRRCRT